MTKSELKTGMVVVNACGEKFIVFKDVYTDKFCGNCIVNVDVIGRHTGYTILDDKWIDLDKNYNENLMNSSPSRQYLNIVKVMSFKQPVYFLTLPNLSTFNNMDVIWER